MKLHTMWIYDGRPRLVSLMRSQTTGCLQPSLKEFIACIDPVPVHPMYTQIDWMIYLQQNSAKQGLKLPRVV